MEGGEVILIEYIVLEYLNNRLEVPVYLVCPENPPEQYVLIEKTGSSVSNYIYSATFALQSYAKSLNEAAELNETVKAAMDELPLLDEVSRSKLNTDYNDTDHDTGQYRYQAVYNITHY